MMRVAVTDHSCLREKTTAVKTVHVGLLSIMSALLGMITGCAKTDVQAPPKEAPSGVTVTSDEAPRPTQQEGPSAAPAPPVVQNQSWPQAEKPSTTAKEERAEAASERQARPASATRAAPKASAAAPKASAAVPRAGGSVSKASGAAQEADLDERADDLLARVNTASEQLTRDYARLTEALQLGVPDCQAAERLRRSVCQLADAVCDLERELPKTTGRRCDDSKHRCSEATRRYESKCAQ